MATSLLKYSLILPLSCMSKIISIVIVEKRKNQVQPIHHNKVFWLTAFHDVSITKRFSLVASMFTFERKRCGSNISKRERQRDKVIELKIVFWILVSTNNLGLWSQLRDAVTVRRSFWTRIFQPSWKEKKARSLDDCCHFVTLKKMKTWFTCSALWVCWQPSLLHAKEKRQSSSWLKGEKCFIFSVTRAIVNGKNGRFFL